jgi:serine/threonine protein kinase/WD40 repeat protein
MGLMAVGNIFKADQEVAFPPPTESVGDRIDNYKLLQNIGEGGCGIVYMAQQEQPVRRQVALKIIKLGMDTRSVIGRFEAERQALALMDHPNIAKVLDAGATQTGRPFFVMELVRGDKITDYCDENQLSTRERLELFIQVCRAIQHAHQKGIIHRDIKPSNILVTLRDGMPVPKVIDFGIAKATTDQLLTDRTVFTEFRQFLGTPAYMSPEQAELSELGIDTRSDIYSLGILLYELLTGKTPFDTRDLLRGGLDEVRRIIRERDPMRPSTRLSTMVAGELRDTARQRHTEPPRLVSLVRGDLDWIVMMALEKDRTRRYETANGLAMDVQRHLANEPVVARPPSHLYRAQKLARRHRLAFGATLAVAAAVVAGTIGTTIGLIGQARESKRARKAELQALQKKQEATDELWHSYVAQARAARFSGQPGRRFDSLEALTKAAAIRFAPELRDEAIACLALPDMKLERRWGVKLGVFDRALQRYAAPATNLGNISVRRVNDDEEILVLPNPAGTVNRIGPFSHNGNFLPVLCNDQELRVWDLARAAVVLTVPFGNSLDGVDFQPGDRSVAVASDGPEICIYELATGAKVNSFATPFRSSCVRYDPLGRMLAISDNNENRIAILDSASGATLRMLTSGEGSDVVGWHPRAPVLAAPGHMSGLIYVWDTVSGQLLHELKGHQNAPGHTTFSRDGNVLVSAGWDGTHLWEPRAGEHLLTCSTAYGEFESFAAGDTAYGQSKYGGTGLERLSLASGLEAQRWHAAEDDRGSKCITFSPDRPLLAFAAGQFVKLFETRQGDLLATLPTGPTAGLCFQKNGNLLVSGERGLFLWPMHAAPGTGEISIGPPEAVDSSGAWQQASLSENGQVFAAFCGDHVLIFEAQQMRQISRTALCGRTNQTRYLSLSPDGQWLASGGWHDKDVKIWNSHTGALITKLADPEWSPDGSPFPAFEPNGRSLVVTSAGSYRVFETNSWTLGLRVPRSESDLPVVAIAHRGELVAIRSGQTSIQLRDVATGGVLATLQSPIRSHIVGLAFSPDDTKLAATHWGTRELLVWDLRLLREELAQMGMDWERPPFPPAETEPSPGALPVRVLTNSMPPAVPGG